MHGSTGRGWGEGCAVGRVEGRCGGEREGREVAGTFVKQPVKRLLRQVELITRHCTNVCQISVLSRF